MFRFLKIYFLLIFFLFSCQSDAILNKNLELPASGWEQGKVLQYSFTVKEKVANCQLYVELRHATSFPLLEFPIKIKIKLPSGKSLDGVYDFKLRDSEGKYTKDSESVGDVTDTRLLLIQDLVLEETGDYTLELSQASKRQTLPGILEVGAMIKLKKI